ncbi:phosphatidate cytidylyltransferase [Siccirubricoccus deserti]|uniref:Phosphatidate cytidylyltransferase n=1 Tax=Siccirubricoccus deserti TaxID=2013562 RepID=A0A9X0QZN6_9PROT|nr:phosphatidate cytidylyltransferase [Siccirubricoccus deserti]MBC4016820.1 CDP-archaeol synthase [Siccirubricoccus deserti]GGC52176.1 phosphatidate cytidylyltransferase [Siccirubricoccus deserti]
MPGPASLPSGAALASRWPDLRKRALSAALLVPAAVLCIWLGAEAWTALMAAAVAVLAWEWVRLCGFSTRRLPGMAVPLLVLAAGTLAVGDAWWPAILLLGLGAVAVWGLARPPLLRQAVPGFWLGFGVVYIGLAGLALIHLRGDAGAGLRNVLFLFLVVWSSDIGAYLAGRRFGGPKLAVRISPNKTWSGAAGGLLSAVAVGLAAAYVMEPAGSAPPLAGVVLVAVVLGLLAQAGDLFESWIKRRFHVKDTSALIPGHGGLLDRLDGVLSAAPAAALLGVLLGPGESLWK